MRLRQFRMRQLRLPVIDQTQTTDSGANVRSRSCR